MLRTHGDDAAFALAPVFEISVRDAEAALEGVVDDWESIDEHVDVIDEPADEPPGH